MCTCNTRINAGLKANNAQLAFGFVLSDADGASRGMSMASPLIMLEKLDRARRGAMPILMATFCPFCGVKLP